jgi:hypothetical protein
MFDNGKEAIDVKKEICLYCHQGEIIQEVKNINGKKTNWRYCTKKCGYLVCTDYFEKSEREVF